MSRRKLLFTIISIAVMLVSAGCGGHHAVLVAPETDDGAQRTAVLQQLANTLPMSDYRLGPGDVLDIKVHGVKDLDLTVRLAESGIIDFPLAGEVEASGRTAAEVQRVIAGRLAERYIHNPHVTVFVKEFNSYRITVVGAVNKPGTVVLRKGGGTVVDALSEAGGLTEKAGNDLYVTIQRESGETETRIVSLKRLLEQGDLTENLRLVPGDSIYVPESGYVFVTGHVRHPGAYQLNKNMTALQAIGSAGDFISTASRDVRLIRRVSSDQVDVQTIDVAAVMHGRAPDVPLEASDVLEARGSLWKVPVYGTVDFIRSVLGVGTTIR